MAFRRAINVAYVVRCDIQIMPVKLVFPIVMTYSVLLFDEPTTSILFSKKMLMIKFQIVKKSFKIK